MSYKPTYQDVCDAAKRIAPRAYKTPVLESRDLNHYFGRTVRFKAEHTQVIGAFKFRGAYNAIAQLTEQQRHAGVITFSSGNHGQAVAKAASLLGCLATVVMPNNAPQIKLNGVRSLGAEVVIYDPHREDREAVADKINPNNTKTLIPPFNHPAVIAGQGTAVLELLSDFPDTEQILVPCGGGGLLSGSILAASGLKPECDVYGIEPEVAADARQSLQQGKIISIPYPDTIADGVRTLSLGEITFQIIREGVTDILTVSEDAIKLALSTLTKHFKQWLEPSAVLGMAALIEQKVPRATSTAIILSGGNADIEIIETIMKTHPAIELW